MIAGLALASHIAPSVLWCEDAADLVTLADVLAEAYADLD